MMPWYTNVAALYGTGGSPPPAGATWSDTNINGHVTLSADKLTATYTIDGTNGLVFATAAITLKTRVEFVFNVTSGGYLGLGVANTSENVNDGSWLGIDTNGIAYRENGEVVYNNVTVATFAGFAQGDIIDMDVDPVGDLIEWFVGGTSVGSHAIGVTGPIYPVCDFKFANTQVTLVQPGSFTNAPPAGFTEYGS